MATEDFTLKINTEFDPGASARESEKLANSFDMIGKEAAQAASGTDDLTDSLGDKLSGAARDSMKAIEGLGDSTEDTNKAVLVSAEGINAWAVNLSNFINIGTAAIAAIQGIAGSLTGFIEGLETSGQELGILESSLNNIQASTSASAEAMDNFTGFLSELSAQSSVSEAELAKVSARFTAVGLSQRDAGEGAIAVLNLVRMTGREVEEVTQAVVDSVKGSAEGLSVLGVNVSDLTVQELLRGDAVDRLNDLYGRSLVPLERTDEFIGEIRRKWDIIRKTLFQSIGSSETIRSIFEVVSKALSEVIERLPDIGTFIDLAFKEAVARVLEFRAGILDAVADVETLITRFSVAGSVLGGIKAAASGNVVGVAVAGAAAGFGARARREGRAGREEARSKAEELRTLADGVRDGTTNIFDELKKIFPFLAEENGKSLKSLLDLLDESKTGSTIARDTNNSLAAQGAAAREAVRVTQAFRAENKASLDALRQAIIDGNLEITSPELELINDVVASLDSGNEVRVRDLEALQALATSIGIANASDIESAGQLLGLLSDFRSNLESEISGLQANFQEQTSLYEAQRNELINTRKQAANQHASRIGLLNKQLSIMETAAKRDEAGILLLREQVTELQEGFAMDAEAIDLQIAALDMEFSELKSEAQEIANREVQNVRDVAERAASQRNSQVEATRQVSNEVKLAGDETVKAIGRVVIPVQRTATNTGETSENTSNFNQTASAISRSNAEVAKVLAEDVVLGIKDFDEAMQEGIKQLNFYSFHGNVEIRQLRKNLEEAIGLILLEERREEARRERAESRSAPREEGPPDQIITGAQDPSIPQRVYTQEEAEEIYQQRLRERQRMREEARNQPTATTTPEPMEDLESSAELQRRIREFEAAYQQQIQAIKRTQIQAEFDLEQARLQLESVSSQTAALVMSAQEYYQLEAEFLQERREQLASARDAFNPFRDPEAVDQEPIPIQISIQLGDQRLADILTDLRESAYGEVLQAV